MARDYLSLQLPYDGHAVLDQNALPPSTSSIGHSGRCEHVLKEGESESEESKRKPKAPGCSSSDSSDEQEEVF